MQRHRKNDSLQSTVDDLRDGVLKAPYALGKYASSPRVKATLIRSLGTCTLMMVPNIADVIGILGGVGAVEALEKKLATLRRTRRGRAELQFDPVAGAATIVARSLLRLDPENIRAANVLKRLSIHRNAVVRTWVAMSISDVLSAESKTEASAVLRRAVQAFARDKEDTVFIAAIPALAVASTSQAPRRRAIRLLSAKDETIRSSTIRSLIAAVTTRSAWPLETIVRNISTDARLRPLLDRIIRPEAVTRKRRPRVPR